jgi:hypothetical protein
LDPQPDVVRQVRPPALEHVHSVCARRSLEKDFLPEKFTAIKPSIKKARRYAT